MRNNLKLFAAGCCLIYLVVYLFLPFVSIVLIGIGAPAINMMSISAWCYLPLLCGIAMLICSLVLPGKPSGIICAVGAFIPLITFFIVQTSVVSNALALFGTVVSSMGTAAISQALTVGIGPILALIAGAFASALCFLSEGKLQKPVQHTAGLGSTEDDEW